MLLAEHTRIEDALAAKADLVQAVMSAMSAVMEPGKGHQARQAASLTKQLLAFSREQVRRPVRLDLNTVVGKTESVLQGLLGEDIELSLQLSHEDCHVVGDSGQLEQVILNLASNARDAMPNGGRLIVSTARARVDRHCYRGGRLSLGDYVVLTIQDTGHGMDEEVKGRVFEPFFTTKPAGVGRGLGLSSVYGTVKQCGGHIGVASAPGAGSTFIIYLPLASRRAAERGVTRSRRPAQTEQRWRHHDVAASCRALAAMLPSSSAFELAAS